MALANVVQFLYPQADLVDDVQIVADKEGIRIAAWPAALGPEPTVQELADAEASPEFIAWTWTGRHRAWARALLIEHLGNEDQQRNRLMEAAILSRAEAAGTATQEQVAQLDLLQLWALWAAAVRAESNAAESEQRDPVAPELPTAEL